jgi:hypothetical protein
MDGAQDIVACYSKTIPPDNWFNAEDFGYVSILQNNGNGTFDTSTDYCYGKGISWALTSIDWNIDNKKDLAIVELEDNLVCILLSDGCGALYGQVTCPVGNGSYALASADINKDGKEDLVVANAWDNNVSVILNENVGPEIPVTPIVPEPTPTPGALQVTVNSKSLRSGDNFSMGVRINRQINDGAGYDAYVGMIPPKGKIRTRTREGKWEKEITPFIENVKIINPREKTLFRLQSIPQGYAGTFKFIAGLVPHGNKPRLSNAAYSDIKNVEVSSRNKGMSHNLRHLITNGATLKKSYGNCVFETRRAP